jgi:hypothetical protein
MLPGNRSGCKVRTYGHPLRISFGPEAFLTVVVQEAFEVPEIREDVGSYDGKPLPSRPWQNPFHELRVTKNRPQRHRAGREPPGEGLCFAEAC